jgi:hypothetical protein
MSKNPASSSVVPGSRNLAGNIHAIEVSHYHRDGHATF